MTNPGRPFWFCLAGALMSFLILKGSGSAQDISSDPETKANRGPVIIKYDDNVPMGTHRVKDKDGRNQIIYSTGGPSERSKMIRESAKEDKDRAWEMLSTIIIDTRSSQDSPDE